jgi:uncharacterized repeat protein (TIGR01451 family)
MSTPSVYRIRPRAKLTRRLFGPVNRSSTFLILLFILLAATLYSGSSASTFPAKSGSRQSAAIARGGDKLVKGRKNPSKKASHQLGNKGVLANLPGFTVLSLLAPQAFDPETITTYDADCMTPKSDFNFGDTVCAKIDGGIPLSISSRRFSWVDPSNNILDSTDVTELPQTDLFVIPPRDLVNDNRGVWRVNSITSRSSVRVSAFFNVSDPNDAAANVLVYNLVNTDTADVASGSNIEFAMWLTNKGPNTATDVEVSNTVNGGATFVDIEQDSGPAFTCTPSGGGTNCTIASLAPGVSARFRVIYQVNGGASPGTVIASTATISSDTPDQNTENNSSLAEIVVTDNSPGSFCALICPGNITRTANTTQGGQDGAIVTYGTGEASGDCGTVTASPVSGSFFPVGTTTVTLSASAGESCTFNVTVTDEPPPTISCPANVTKDAGDECRVEVTGAELGTPTTTGTGVTVAGQRSDGLDLDAPYPLGTTTVTWTATDALNRTASCNQTVTVTGTDNTPPTITAPPDITDNTGAAGAACGKIIGEGALGTATTEDNCSTIVTVTRTGVPSGNFFPVGTTTITYTAKDGSGNTATATQTITITENTPPIIEAPPDANYVCLSDVPAAHPSQATRGDVFDENGNLLPPAPPSDNCGIPVVTVSETSSGAGSAASPRIILRTFTATDASGNSASDTQTITVIDDVPPSISLNGASSMTVECHTSFTDPGASASDNCSGATVTVSGSVDLNTVGTYTLQYTAIDAAGNQSPTVTRTVNVVDTTPPTISCPSDIIADFNPEVGGAVVTYTTPVGADNCSATTTQIAGLPSGATFPLGTTVNTFRVTDSVGHTAECSFNVTVALTSIVGLDSVSISGAALVDSYDSNGGYAATKGSSANVVSNGTITLTNTGKVAGNVRSTRAGVVMSGATQVTGNATAGTTVSKSGSATVGGTITNNQLAPVMVLPAVTACGPPYSSNSGISGNYSYNASTGDLSLSGVNIATLANGTYCFRNVTISNSAQLKVNGPVVIKITGTLNAGGATSINNTTMIPSNLRILSSYTGSNGVALGNSSNAYMMVYAPNTGITISGAGPLFGTAVGKTVTISNSARIHYDLRLKAIWPDVWTLILGN